MSPKSSAQQVKTQPGIVELVDKLLDKYIYSEIAELLNQQGYRPGGSARCGRNEARFTALHDRDRRKPRLSGRAGRQLTALGPSPPRMHQARSNVVLARKLDHAQARPQAFLGDPKLIGSAPSPPSIRTRNHTRRHHASP